MDGRKHHVGWTHYVDLLIVVNLSSAYGGSRDPVSTPRVVCAQASNYAWTVNFDTHRHDCCWLDCTLCSSLTGRMPTATYNYYHLPFVATPDIMSGVIEHSVTKNAR